MSGTTEMNMQLIVDEHSALFNRDGMFFKEFPSDFRQIRYFTLLIVQKAPPEIKEINLLEQQISEIIKNAVKHGNHSDPEKKVKVWYTFTDESAHLIVEDEGEGFQDLEKWNEFNRRRLQCLHEQNYDELADFIAFRTEKSDEIDGGNALFAALEYWDGGVIYTNKRNCVAVMKKFQKKHHSIEL